MIAGLRARFGRRLPLEFRMDAAFCQPAVLRLLAVRGCGYAIKTIRVFLEKYQTDREYDQKQ
ncbi:MAG TPA: hypothetical protein VJX92_03675 [Methylomirabilota bacterium]|nr:hypothetical protein [Methylomirabilota bacterium]